MEHQKKILIVEDEESHLELILCGLESLRTSYNIITADNLSRARELISEYNPALIISDWRLPDGEGTSLINKDSSDLPVIPVVLMTSYGNEQFAVDSFKKGALDYIVKSAEMFMDMAHIAEKALKEWEIRYEKKMIEDRLSKLYHAVEQSNVGVVIAGTDGIIEYINPEFERITGYSINEVIGKKTNILKSGQTSDDIYSNLWNTILAGNVWKGEFLNKKKNGELYWESDSISPIKNKNGDITSFLAIKEDITRDMEMQLTIRKALDKAEEASRLKSSLLANMSHEFRTPLNGIIGYSNILKEDVQDPEHREMLEKILKSSARLLSTLNSVLNFSELESGSVAAELKVISAADIAKFINTYYEQINEHELGYTLHVKDNNMSFIADRNMIEHVIDNLISNAIKFTVHGNISVDIYPEYINSEAFAVIKVTDTGIGIEEDKLEMIFEEFRQISEGISRKYEGNGLGLSVSRRMVQLMGGTLRAESRLGEGSSFYVRLPGKVPDSGFDSAAPTVMKECGSKETDEQPKLSILIVEDNIYNADVVKLYLRKNYILDFAYSGNEALEKTGINTYDLILMDINLGGMDGVETRNIIKQNPRYLQTPVIAVTGFASFNDKARFLSLGFDNYLAKPFKKAQLLELIQNVLKT
ncbi:MAG: response regulator [Syntrophothermus sp.]